jgi:hypothetical protein
MVNHRLVVSLGDSNFNDTLQDYVFTKFDYYYISTEETEEATKTVTTLHTLYLPEPNSENFIPAKDVLPEVRKQWVEQLIEPILPFRQQENIEKLQQL